MGKFQFSDNSVHLDIAGNLYRIPYNAEFVAKIKELGTCMVENSKKLQQEADEAKVIETAIQIIYDGIDKILGDGASAAIFADKERDIFDAIDVANYIFNEFSEFQKSKTAQLNRKKTGSKK